jgi:hypothetical protein
MTSRRSSRSSRRSRGRRYGNAPLVVVAPDGRVLNRSRNLAGIRKFVGKDPITRIVLARRSGGEGTLKLTLYSGATFEAPFADYTVMRNFVARWRNASGVPVEEK